MPQGGFVSMTGGSAGSSVGAQAGVAGTAAQAGVSGVPENGGAAGGPVLECSPDDRRLCSVDGALGNCAAGHQECDANGTWGECDIQPADADSCEPGDDANCNGIPNQGCACDEGDVQPCGDTVDRGMCHRGTSTCTQGAYGECLDAIYPSTRDCRSEYDNDCNGTADYQETAFCECPVDGQSSSCDTGLPGVCAAGTHTCAFAVDNQSSDYGDCTGPSPGTRDCRSAEDNDCNGTADDQETSYCRCVLGTDQPCDTHPEDGTGLCTAGSQPCAESGDHSTTDYGECSGSTGPTPELCTGDEDEDCDGDTDNDDSDCVASMISIPQGYLIDRTEVTRGQYQAWLDTEPTTAGQSSDCTWNDRFVPDAACMADPAVQQSDATNHPQVCVDWCDAYAYCLRVGKRLCGGLGGGGAVFTEFANINYDQWYNACTSHGTNAFPYGASYDEQACNGSDYSGTDNQTIQVGTLESCQTPAGVFDLSGNVWEWEDCCNGSGPAAYCKIRGGSAFNAGSTSLRCVENGTGDRNHFYPQVGFRCCSG